MMFWICTKEHSSQVLIYKIFARKYNFYVFSPCVITVIIIEVVLGIGINDGELGYPPLRYECGSHDQTSHVRVIRLDSSAVQDVFLFIPPPPLYLATFVFSARTFTGPNYEYSLIKLGFEMIATITEFFVFVCSDNMEVILHFNSRAMHERRKSAWIAWEHKRTRKVI